MQELTSAIQYALASLVLRFQNAEHDSGFDRVQCNSIFKRHEQLRI